ncbi:DUF2079 domain-containing protein [Kitasatospora purpeofusca]|uniref:DUF2079 domain-containing protein n=1 Tax=Kitasatospora purpeofusca TaxID=67352 RepID=UPI0022502850|nr:DUF2079 domain-containing protein [Kitasatospora purpeofusca]MCX4752027.1 DUF2079 domain-containing protein [Kitasatospora purpeofusca]MCX4757882.1 DUF2079 domain-containing protein [Kitasatospora purpeofusca]WSR31631.1 DUF2079 domain-containing protein [Kitasatospora purpeofusca]
MSRHDVTPYPDTEGAEDATSTAADPAADPATAPLAGPAAEPALRIPPRARTLGLTLLCFAVCLAIGLQQWTTAQLGGFDLGIFDQGVRGYAHLGLPVSTLKSFHHEFPPGFSLLGDHFSPVIALMAPLYWIWDDPRSLLLGQALCFAAGVPLIRRIAGRCFADADPRTARRAADLAALAYGLGWPLLVASRGGFHEVAFAVPLTLLMLERGMARQYWASALAGLLLCCTKEDMGLAVGAYGLVLLLRARRDPDPARRRPALRWGAGLLIGGPLASAVAIAKLVPAMGGVPGYYWNYQALGEDGGSAVANVLADPTRLLAASFDAPLKPLLLLWIFGTLCALPLRSATVLLAVPLLAERVLSSNPNHWSIARHYDAFLWPILLVAALEVLGRCHGRVLTRRLGVAAAALTVAAAVPLGLANLFVPAYWQPKASEAALLRGAALVPDGASVEADNQAAPRLTARADVVLVDEKPRGREYVLIRADKRSFPFRTDREQAERIELLLAHGYRTVWSEDGVYLLHREGTEPVPGEQVPGPDAVPYQDAVPSDVGHNLFRG